VMGPWPRNRRNEVRQGTLNTYIRRARPRANLTILAGALVDRVLVAGTRASGVRYIDSTRLGEIIAAHITVSRQGGRLKLVGTPDRIVELLEIAGLGGIFERYASADDAKKSLA